MVRKTKKQKGYLTPNEVAAMLMVSPTTIRQWASAGQLTSLTTRGGHRRFMRSEIERFARQNGLTLQLPDSQTMRILIVDDDKNIGDLLTKVFSRVAASVDTMVADNGFDAGRLVQGFRPHVVLLDLTMPGIDGFEVCQTIKQDPASKATRILAMTEYYEKDNVSRILAAGAEICLAKPFEIATLLDAIGIEPERTPASRSSD